MAVFNKILKDCRGGIGTAVLAGILCAAVCLHAAAYWVLQEAEENSRRILRRQLQFAVQALAKAGFENGSLPEGGINLPPQKLYPGNYTLKAGIFEENTSGGIKNYTVQAEAGGETFALQQLQIAFLSKLRNLVNVIRLLRVKVYRARKICRKALLMPVNLVKFYKALM